MRERLLLSLASPPSPVGSSFCGPEPAACPWLRSLDPMIVCVPITEDGQVGGGFGRASRVAVADVAGGEVGSWAEYDVGWDRLHDEGGEGAHHARIVRFVREHEVTAVVTRHMGPGMQHTLAKMRVAVHLGADGAARTAVLLAG